MFVAFEHCLINVLLAVFVSKQYVSASVPDKFFENRIHNVHIGQNEFDKLYHTSKHVFYWLYTRDNPGGQRLNRSETHMTESTTYNPKNELKVIVHGWLGSTQEKEGLCSYNKRAYLNVSECNVICVDWKQYSTDLSYATAKFRAKYIGKDLARVLNKITYNMSRGVENLHLIGHSMGAHIVGFTGKILANQIPRITGLDPAKPLYDKSGPEDRLHVTDALFVDVMHTNGDQNGIMRSLGHIDFFPNGGKVQPNCNKVNKGSCSHITSYHYFSHSIWAKEDYVACKSSSWEEYETNGCAEYANSTYMGEFADPEQTGDYYLEAYVRDE